MLDVTDLIGIKYQALGTDPATGVDCFWAARAAAMRIFPSMTGDELPISPEEQTVRLAQARREECKWRRVGDSAFDAKLEGDLLVGSRPDGGLFAALCIDPIKGSFITAFPDFGVQVVNRRRLGQVSDVFRRFA